DKELLMAADHELDSKRAAEVQNHMAACLACRRRSSQLTNVLMEFSDAVHAESDIESSSRDQARALLRAQLAEVSEQAVAPWFRYSLYAGAVLAFILVVGVTVLHMRTSGDSFIVGREAQLLPDPKLTPGNAGSLTKAEICTPIASSSHFIPPATA